MQNLLAAHLSEMQPALETVALSAMPAMPETFRVIKAAIQQARGAGQTPVVNFTGGTKLMSIGAYAAALDQKALSLYVDTSDALFVDGRTADGLAGLLEDDFSFTPLRSLLTVGCVAAAHGQARVTTSCFSIINCVTGPALSWVNLLFLMEVQTPLTI
jgi:hypothetical protein